MACPTRNGPEANGMNAKYVQGAGSGAITVASRLVQAQPELTRLGPEAYELQADGKSKV